MRMCSYMEQMHVHDCQRMSSECDREHSTTKDTDHTRSYDTKNTPVHFTATANQVSRSS